MPRYETLPCRVPEHKTPTVIGLPNNMTVPPMEDATEAVTTTIGSSEGIPDLEKEDEEERRVASVLDRTLAAPPPCSEFICVVDDDTPHHHPSAVATSNGSPSRSKPSASKQPNAPRCCLMELGKCRKMKKGTPHDGAAVGDLEETTMTTTTPTPPPHLPTEPKSPSDNRGADVSNSGGSSTEDDDEYSEEEELNYRSIRDVSYTPTAFQIYAPPRQRQEWGQKQILPRVNWGDLFFGTCPCSLLWDCFLFTFFIYCYSLPYRSLLRGGCLQCKETIEKNSLAKKWSLLFPFYGSHHHHHFSRIHVDRPPIFS